MLNRWETVNLYETEGIYIKYLIGIYHQIPPRLAGATNAVCVCAYTQASLKTQLSGRGFSQCWINIGGPCRRRQQKFLQQKTDVTQERFSLGSFATVAFLFLS